MQLWRVNPNAVINGDQTDHQAICDALEWYICECLKYCPTELLHDWWSDGVLRLDIKILGENTINLLGVTWIDSNGIAPFSIDVVLDPNFNDRFTKTIFRIGMTDERGLPILCDENMDFNTILQLRPKNDRDWAMAIELTPPVEK